MSAKFFRHACLSISRAHPGIKSVVSPLLALFITGVLHGQEARVAEIGREVARRLPPLAATPATGTEGGLPPAQELPDSREYGEVGILHDATPETYFAFSLDAAAYYTSNATLRPKNEIDDWYFNQGLSAQWSRGFLASTLFPRVSVSQDWYEYARTDSQLKNSEELLPDFSVFEGSAGLAWRVKGLGNIILSADYAYERLANLELSDETFYEHHLRTGVSHTIAVSSTHTFFLGAQGDFSLETDPAPVERTEYRAYAGYSIAWTPELSTSLAYYYGFYDYQNRPREDHNHTISAGAVWQFHKNAGLRLRLDLTRNNSSVDAFDYDNLTAGISAAVAFRW